MKKLQLSCRLFAASVVVHAALRSWQPALAQSVLVYDQQSASGGLALGGTPIQFSQPVGQSFTPAASFVGFAQLQFADPSQNNGIGSTVFINLREHSMTGNVLAASAPLAMPNKFWGIASFAFSTNILVTPDSTYFLEAVLVSGDDTHVLSDFYDYSGGTAYFSGHPSSIGLDLWFREGYMVPEPSVLSLVAIGAGFLLWRLKQRS